MYFTDKIVGIFYSLFLFITITSQQKPLTLLIQYFLHQYYQYYNIFKLKNIYLKPINITEALVMGNFCKPQNNVNIQPVFQHIQSQQLTEKKWNPIEFNLPLLQSKFQNKNGENHGPNKQMGEFTGQQTIKLDPDIELKAKSPFQLKQEIHGIQKHLPFKFKKTGEIYHGEWSNGKPQGFGKLYNPNTKTYYQGIFHQHIPTNYGRVITFNSGSYVGEIAFGRANGEGTYKHGNIQIKGYFKDNQPHGKCIEQTPHYKYEGNFENGKWDGKGELIYNNNKNIYIGQFEGGKFNGVGIQTTQDYTYEGEYKNGLKEGKGRLEMKSGHVYIGQFHEDQAEGSGQLRLNSELIYYGNWKNGKAHGMGNYIQQGKMKMRGWQNGKIAKYT